LGFGLAYPGLIKSILLILILVGCTPTSLIIDSSKVDYGVYPENYKAIVKEYFFKYFPHSVAFAHETQKPFKAYKRLPPILGGGVEIYGYLVYVKVITIHVYAYSSYTTREEYRLLIRNGKVVARINPNKYHFGESWYQ